MELISGMWICVGMPCIAIKLSDSEGPALQATILILIFSIPSFTFDFSLSLLSHSCLPQPVTQTRWLQWPEPPRHWRMDGLIELSQFLVHHRTEPEVFFPDISETTIHIAWMLILGLVHVGVYFSLSVCLFVVVYAVMITPMFVLFCSISDRLCVFFFICCSI